MFTVSTPFRKSLLVLIGSTIAMFIYYNNSMLRLFVLGSIFFSSFAFFSLQNWFRRWAKPTIREYGSQSNIKNDRPLTDWRKDCFERTALVENLVESLSLSHGAPSVSVSLEGEWGEGKTSIINEVRKQLIQKDFFVFDFNPWIVGDLGQLIDVFIEELATFYEGKGLSASSELVSCELRNYLRRFANISSLANNNSVNSLLNCAVQLFASSDSLLHRKRKVNEAIVYSGRGLVVIIDDIDRLPPSDVRTIFQLVKSICDFTRTSYLLAYDPKPIAKILEYDGAYNGTKFIEKIIQHRVQIPRLRYLHKKAFLVHQLRDAFPSEKYNKLLSDYLFKEALVYTTRLMENSRDIVRLVNSVSPIVKNLSGEVSDADTLVFLALINKEENLAEIIQKNPGLFIGNLSFDSEEGSFSYIKKVSSEPSKNNIVSFQTRFHGFLREYNLKYKYERLLCLEDAIQFIFPNAFDEKNSEERQDILDKRIRVVNNFIKLLHASKTKIAYSSNDVERFINYPKDRITILSDHLNMGAKDLFLNHLIATLDSSKPKAPVQAVLDIARFEDGSLRYLSSYTGKIADKIMLSQDLPVAEEIFKRLVMHDNLSLGEHFLLRVLTEYRLWENGIYMYGCSRLPVHKNKYPFDIHFVAEVADDWVNWVEQQLKSGVSLWNEAEPISILFRLAQISQNSSFVHNYIEQQFTDSNNIRMFLKSFIGHGFNGVEKIIKNTTQTLELFKSVESHKDVVRKYEEYCKSLNAYRL